MQYYIKRVSDVIVFPDVIANKNAAGHRSACIDRDNYLTTLWLFCPFYVQSAHKAYEYE